MKKHIGLWVFLGIVVLLLIYGYTSYNTLVQMDETVKTAWANVETQYQRRADLIPNLVNTVKGYASHESQTLQAVTEARAGATAFQLSVEDLTPEKMEEFQRVQSQLQSALSRLLAVAESYPDLKASQNFNELQAQLEGTENRIAVARQDFNNVVREYNVTVRSFPRNLMAGLFGFDQKPSFAASAGAETAPTVEF